MAARELGSSLSVAWAVTGLGERHPLVFAAAFAGLAFASYWLALFGTTFALLLLCGSTLLTDAGDHRRSDGRGRGEEAPAALVSLQQTFAGFSPWCDWLLRRWGVGGRHVGGWMAEEND